MSSYRSSIVLTPVRVAGLAVFCLLGMHPGAASAAPAVSTIAAFSASAPSATVIKGPDAALYGTTLTSTTVTGGLLYRSTPDGSSVTTVYQFGNQDGISPSGGVLLASDGKFYGVTKFGRSGVVGSTGTIFRVGVDGSSFTTLHTFEPYTQSNQDSSPINTDGAYPETELIEGSDGYLYSVARTGGANGTGTIFKISSDGTDFRVLHVFGAITSAAGTTPSTNADGISPTGSLVEGPDGYFYGTASAGGANGKGTVFRIHFDGTGFQVLHTFTATTVDATTKLSVNSDGAAPAAGLIDGGDGLLYGVASQGGAHAAGTVFAMTPDGGTFTVLHDFEADGGSTPLGELLLASDGKLYGTTSAGGKTTGGSSSTYGTLFSIARDGTGFTTMYSFDNTEGRAPAGRLLQLGDGLFVGIASGGGKCSQGTLFRYSAAGDTVTGSTNCGYKRRKYGTGATEPALLLLLGGLALRRRRR